MRKIATINTGPAMLEAVILAGGRGTRLQGAVPGLPKPMAPVAGRPFLEILLARLATQGVCRCILSVGYLADIIIKHFGSSFRDMEIVYARESAPLGTGGGLRLALEQCTAAQVFVFNGDSFLDVSVKDIERAWLKHRQPVIVGVPVEDTLRYGRISSQNGLVTGFEEKELSGPGVINAGCYVLPKDLLNTFPLGASFSLERDFLIPNLNARPFRLFTADGVFIDIGVPTDYRRAQTLLAGYA